MMETEWGRKLLRGRPRKELPCCSASSERSCSFEKTDCV